MSDGESTCSSDEGSLSSSCSSLDDEFEDDDFIEDIPEVKTPPPQQAPHEPAIFEAENASMAGFRQEHMHWYVPAVPEPIQPMHVPVQPMCAPKFHPEPFGWDRMKFAPAPQLHHPVPFHHQVPLFTAHMQGCY